MPSRSPYSKAFRPFQSRQRLPDPTRPILMARVDQFLALEERDQPAFLASLTNDLPGGVAQFVAEVVRRVVAGKAKPSVLKATGSRAALPLFSESSRTYSAIKLQRIQRALDEIVPAIAADRELVELLKMKFWSQAGADRNRLEPIPETTRPPVVGGT